MDVKEKVLEGLRVVAVVGRGQVTSHDDRHARVEVEARVETDVGVRATRQEVESHGMVKVREVVTHGNRGRGEDDTLHLGKPAPREVGTHVDLLGAELLLADASLGARELRGVDVGGVLPRADEPDAGEKVAQEAT